MKALLIRRDEEGRPELSLEDHADPVPAPGEVRIQTKVAGICNTDLEIVKGYAEFEGILGHEFVGVVELAEDEALLGRRVVGEINAACLACETCQAGRPRHCPNRTVLGIQGRHGVLAEAFCLPARNLHLVPRDVPDEVAVFTEPLAAACEVVEQVHVLPTSRVTVLGDGKLGLLTAQVLALTGCELTVVGRHPSKLAILAGRGIKTQLAGGETDGTEDVVVDCTGSPDGFRAAQRLVRPAGTIVLKSTFHGQALVGLSQLVVDEVTVVGSRCGPFPPALRLLRRGWVDVIPLIEAVYPLSDGLAAFEHAGRRGALKVIVKP